MVKRLVIVLGSPGAGKTSLIKSLRNTRAYKLANLGDIMFELGKKQKLVEHRDEMKYLSPDEQTDLRDSAAEQIAKLDGNVVLETHASVEQHGRFFPGLPFYMMNHFKHITGLFYIDAETDQIMKRRQRDKTRPKREIEEKWMIDTQRDVNLAILSYYSTYLNIPLYIIDNKEGKLKETTRMFKNQLEDAFGE
jgi:adenylate kinase